MKATTRATDKFGVPTSQEPCVSTSFLGAALMSVGAMATVAGALLYVLPGPGLPVLVLGLALTAAGVAVRTVGSR
ncbi:MULTISPECIES: hypothetical protein [Streptomyces]|uniref:hypothetical protein n=1 Tax=Streptomyces TaxID=1883 RepID=UPI001489FB74|nr:MULTISPECIES: hypothetical protein [Streptomyces]